MGHKFIRPLSETHSKVQLPNTEIFYEILPPKPPETSRLLKIFNNHGVLKVTRQISIPPHAKEIFTCNHLVLAYSREHQQLTVIDINEPDRNDKTCAFKPDLVDLEANGRVIIQTMYSETLNSIVFVDVNHDIFRLNVLDNGLELIWFYNPNQYVDRIEVDDQFILRLLFHQDKIMRKIKVDWQRNSIMEINDEYGVWDFHYCNFWRVIIRENKHNLNRERREEKFLTLTINETAYEEQVESVGNMISGAKYFVYFNFEQGYIIYCFEGVSNRFENEAFMMNKVQNHHSSFMVNFTQMRDLSIKMELLVFENVIGKFQKHIFSIRLIQGKEIDVFIKNNIEKLFKTNGLVHPHYESILGPKMPELVNSFDSNGHDSHREFSEDDNDNGKLSTVDLSCRLLFYLLAEMPEECIRLAKHLIAVSEEKYLRKELWRFLQYCNKILSSLITEGIRKIYNDVHSNSFRPRSNTNEEEIEKYMNVTTNMSNFLFIIHRAIVREQQGKAHLQPKGSAILEPENPELGEYETTLWKCRSLNLIIKMVITDKIAEKLSTRFREYNKLSTINTKMRDSCQLLVRNDIKPLLLYEYFRKIRMLYTNERMLEFKPEFRPFFDFLLKNSDNFYEIAYFYQSILNPMTIPYVSQDIHDMYRIIDHIITPYPSDSETKKSAGKLFPKLTSIVLKLGLFPFLKYVAQLTMIYEEYKYMVLIFNSAVYCIPNDQSLAAQEEHEFILKGLLIAGKFLLAQLYLAKIIDPEQKLFKKFVMLAVANKELKKLIEARNNKEWKEKECEMFDDVLKECLDIEEFEVLKEFLVQ